MKRTFIIANDEPSTVNGISGWISKIHPVYAMIFSFLSKPIEHLDAISELARFLGSSHADVENLLDIFLASNEPVVTEYGGEVNIFPPSIILEYQENLPIGQDYTPQCFIYNDVDLKTERFITSPLGLVWMVNNKCSTNCIYCYADKKTKSKMLSISVIKKICENAKALHIKSFQVTGGEFFLYPNWKELLDMLIKFDYKPSLISTKMPLSESDVSFITNRGIKIQISLDSLNPSILSRMLKVSEQYSENIQESISTLERYNAKYQIATVLTNLNSSIESLTELYQYISQLKNVLRWEVRVGFKSLYSSVDFDSYKLKEDSFDIIDQWLQEIKKCSHINILWSKDNGRKYFESEIGSKGFSGSRCSANYSHLVILPDGKVTICEQLYWNKRFIIGDVEEQTIEEIWQSPEAISISNIQQKNIRKESACAECKLYDACISYPNKCYTDILKIYGEENWDYPDPRCKFAPPFVHN